MKFTFILITTLLFTLIASKVFAVNYTAAVTQRIEREDRPALTSKSKVLFPFSFISSNGGRYTFYEPAGKITLYEDNNVYYVRFDELGDIFSTGWMGADDLLVSLPANLMGGFRKGQKVCLKLNTVYLKAGESLKIKDFYENNYVTLYSPGIFRALDSRDFAVHLSEIRNCR